MKKLLPLTLLTFLLLTTAHALFFAGRSVSNYRSIGGIKIDKMGGKTTGIKKINGINFRKKVFDPTEGMVGWWKFDGDATDASGNGNDGTVYGATLTTDREGNSDGAYSFDGNSNSYVSTGDTEQPSNAITMSVWVKFDSFYAEQINWSHVPTFINKGKQTYNNHYWFGYSVDREELVFELGNGQTRVRNYHDFIPDFGIWYHIVGTYNSYMEESKFYLNGIPVNTIKHQGFGSLGTNDYPLYIGKYRDYNHSLDGSIDDVRIYNRALTAEEVQLLYEKY